MTLKTGASVAVLTIMLGISPAAAQMSQQKPAEKPSATTEVPKAPVSGQIMTQDANTVLARDFIGLVVYSPDKTKVGTISDLILTKDAKSVEGFLIGVGGFLGIGEKSVALKMDRLQISNTAEGAVQLTMDVKKEELTNAPSFKSKREMDNEKRAAESQRNVPTRPSTGN
jgi:sporulation protein YlmC with PRC-barrel domain